MTDVAVKCSPAQGGDLKCSPAQGGDLKWNGLVFHVPFQEQCVWWCMRQRSIWFKCPE